MSTVHGAARVVCVASGCSNAGSASRAQLWQVSVSGFPTAAPGAPGAAGAASEHHCTWTSGRVFFWRIENDEVRRGLTVRSLKMCGANCARFQVIARLRDPPTGESESQCVIEQVAVCTVQPVAPGRSQQGFDHPGHLRTAHPVSRRSRSRDHRSPSRRAVMVTKWSPKCRNGHQIGHFSTGLPERVNQV